MKVGGLLLSCCALAAIVTVAANRTVTAGAKASVTHTVTIENMQFSPAQLTVHVGDRIVFSNKDLFPHTATADDKSFDSGSIAPNAHWTYRASKAGQHAYKCTFHTVMLGSITVQ